MGGMRNFQDNEGVDRMGDNLTIGDGTLKNMVLRHAINIIILLKILHPILIMVLIVGVIFLNMMPLMIQIIANIFTMTLKYINIQL